MSRHDRSEIEMELLQFLESLWILAQIGEIKITELLFENAVPVKNFLLREKHEDTIQRALEDQDLAAYAAKLGLDVARLIREVTSSIYAQRIREDFKSGMRGGVNGTPTFFINGERYDGARDLKHLLNALTPQRA